MRAPKGSILRQLLFLIYMNDIRNSSNHLDFILYVDDTTVFNTIEFSTPNEDFDPFKSINDELHKVSDWLEQIVHLLISRNVVYDLPHP